MTLPTYLKAHAEGATLAVKAQPRAGKTEIVGPAGAELKIRIAAPPVDSAANEALVRFIAETCNCPRGAVQLARGGSSTHKLILIRGLTPEQVAEALEAQG